MKQIELKALAKINLGLDVLGRRENGYHDVRMIMQSIYLYDEVKIKRTKNPGIEIKTNLYFLPTGKENIAYKAAEMLIEEFHIEEGVHITLNKHIPVAAGMAGGSSNAAAVLYGMNKLPMGVVGISTLLALVFTNCLDAKSEVDTDRTDGARSKAWCRCSVLYYARDSFGRGYWRRIDHTHSYAEMFCVDRKTTNQCVYESCL